MRTKYVPDISQLDADQLVSMTDAQVGLLAAIPPSSLNFHRTKGGLKPAVPNSTVYRVGDLREFCIKKRLDLAARLANATLAANPGISPLALAELVHQEVARHLEEIAAGAE